ncbi:MAG: glycosyl hydrolase [Candidatus Sumerlaeaceae bacterium]
MTARVAPFHVVIIALMLSGTAAPVPAAEDTLAAQFRNPPASAKPHTWWHWMDGNVTSEGITADLNAMKDVGIGGAQMFHVSQNIPAGPVGYMSAKWQEMVLHALKEAERTGIEICLHNCAGWSSSGGPWITPEHAMQVIAWSQKPVRGPAHVSEILPEPKPPQVHRAIPYYKDIAVLAYQVPPGGDAPMPPAQILGKTGVVREHGLQPDLSPTTASQVIARDSILVLTDKLTTSGHLTWDAPEGDWMILRIGYTPTGKNNHPAPPEGDGLEVDKLSREALDVHWNAMMGKIIAQAGPLAGKVLNNALIDSYEVGSQNWTPRFREEFQKRRGYDLLQYLPVITGRIVGSKEESERFLWDFRRTIADLFADNYFKYFGELCHQHGMLFSTEPYGNGGFDTLECGGLADIPMGEFWVHGAAIETTKLAASVAHTYGRKLVGAEAFTAEPNHGRWLIEPYGIKAMGDLAFCNGINRYIFHRYAHQPWMDFRPGMTMGPWGTHLERTVTWWKEAATWMQYVARCQYLLQEGTFVADLLYYYGESTPNDLPYRPNLNPAVPAGYDYDGCDATVLRERATVRDGRIVLSDGMSYSVLVLPDGGFMTPPVAKAIRELVRAGATVVGPKPRLSPSLTGYPQCDTEVRSVADEVWAGVDGAATKEHRFGKGRVIWGRALADVLAELKVPADFSFQGAAQGAKLACIHRRIKDADVYFVSNQRTVADQVECTFRVGGRVPELWHPDTGVTGQAMVYREQAGRTTLPLWLNPAESVFVVFRRAANEKHLENVALEGHPKVTTVTLPQLLVRKARYESMDGRGADVTTRVAEMVAAGEYEIPASNEVFGDSVPLVVKRLRIEYELDGKPIEKTADEGHVLTLVDRPRVPVQFPAFEVSADSEGVATLTAWKAGKYEVQRAGGTTQTVTVNEAADVVEVKGPWTVAFEPGMGAPPSVKLDALVSWPNHADNGVRYFSGTAHYETQFDLPAELVGKRRVVALDFGRVKNFATIRLNGTDLPVLWKEPFRMDVSKAVKSGRNQLEVKVTNLWPNRLIGDEQFEPDADWDGDRLKGWPEWLTQGKPRPSKRITFTTWRFYHKTSPLLESGLLGPVTVRSAGLVTLP